LKYLLINSTKVKSSKDYLSLTPKKVVSINKQILILHLHLQTKNIFNFYFFFLSSLRVFDDKKIIKAHVYNTSHYIMQNT